MANETKDDEMICGLTMDERDALRRGLAELPGILPPRIVWNRIREQAEAEGLVASRMSRQPLSRIGGLGIAAGVVLAVIFLPRLMNVSEPGAAITEPPITTSEQALPVTALQALMVQSQQLESDLRALPDEPRVLRASTVATIADIEHAVAAIDFQLNDPDAQMTPDEIELFWRERVRLMKSLVQLRYAQAQRTAF